MTHISRHGGKTVAFFNIFLFAILELVATIGFVGTNNVQHHSVELATKTSFNNYENKTPIDPIETSNLTDTFKTTVTFARATTPSYSTAQTASASTLAPNYINLGGNLIPIVYSEDTGQTPANAAARFFGNANEQGKFLYAHNRAHLFAPLAYLSVGDTFTANLDGITRQYIISYKTTLPKSSITNGQMHSLARAEWNGVSYNLSLMTCAGANDVNRTIVLANAL